MSLLSTSLPHLDGLASKGQPVVLPAGVNPMRDGAKRGPEEAVLQCVWGDLLNPAGNGVDSSPDTPVTHTRSCGGSGGGNSDIIRNVVVTIVLGNSPAWETKIAQGPAVSFQEVPGLVPMADVWYMDDHAVGVSSNYLRNFALQQLLIGIHGQESQDHEIEKGTDDGQSHQDIHEAKGHVEWLPLQGTFGLQGHKVSEAYSSQCNEAVVVGVEEAPVLALGEGSRPKAQGAHAGEESDGHHVFHGNVSVTHATTLLDTLQQAAHEGVHALTQTLEHDQRQRDAQHSIEHTEGLASVGARCSVSISYGKEKRSEDSSQEQFCEVREKDGNCQARLECRKTKDQFRSPMSPAVGGLAGGGGIQMKYL